LYFREFIAFSVVQENGYAVLVAELSEGVVEALQLLKALIITYRVLCSWHALETVAREVTLLHGMQSLPRKAPALVNKEVVHHTTQPGSWLVYRDEIIELAKGLDQQLLKQVFCLGFGTSESPGEAVEALEVRSNESFEGQVLFCGSHNVPECITTSGPNKGSVDSLRQDAAATP
jgi:hypothetical protein